MKYLKTSVGVAICGAGLLAALSNLMLWHAG